MEAVSVNDQPSINTSGNGDGPLVAVTFQKNPYQTQKYLEAEPKALGVTQITLSVFQISMVLGIFMATDHFIFIEVFSLVGSLFAIIAGSIAIAALNLHLPTLKACVGMQVVACGTSAVSVILRSGMFNGGYGFCWYSMYNDTESPKLCVKLESGIEHYNAELLLINIAILAISVTLTTYCCKIVNCCTPRDSMPVITVSAPPAQR
ncbi:hypothetical protein COCON_G00044570 [Conger conger]|uniref:Membrane-spanning 4-domains subfamily A member 4A-like n=1 Tax=Conger conger TaxID=82655 RepID=A0A9Q1I520_CONCO|nr:uncharacterized protein si:ch211-212k18.8 [Conger conger]XP_061092461.1 uncharacterized protein si:ch211-212k18.8 [Conger conger]KAJ8281938.1 hypothetical protein COCON_G00044570 [Conger conger]